jgi:hypothetical protein
MVLPINAIQKERLAVWKSSKMHHGAVAVCNVAENNYVNVGAHGAFVGRNKIYVMRTTNGHDWTRMPRRRAVNQMKICLVIMNSECCRINGSGGSAVSIRFAEGILHEDNVCEEI